MDFNIRQGQVAQDTRLVGNGRHCCCLIPLQVALCACTLWGAATALTSIRQHTPVGAIVSIRLQEGNEGLADGHVVGRSVVVQLLVPVLHPGAPLLANVITMHDVQDLVTYSLHCVALNCYTSGALER